MVELRNLSSKYGSPGDGEESPDPERPRKLAFLLDGVTDQRKSHTIDRQRLAAFESAMVKALDQPE
jgi:hypothetical protein